MHTVDHTTHFKSMVCMYAWQLLPKKQIDTKANNCQTAQTAGHRIFAPLLWYQSSNIKNSKSHFQSQKVKSSNYMS